MKKLMFTAGATSLLLVSCQKEANQKPLTDLEKKGRAIYVTNCIACHNPDPRLDGSTGPSVSGSSFDLIEKRVIHRSYPEGYSPKRSSDIMPDFEGLKDDINEIHAYLNAFNS